MSIGALRITIGLPLLESPSETCTATCLLTPCVLMRFCLLTFGPSSVGRLGRTILCTVDFAAPVLAGALAASLYTNLLCSCTWVTDSDTILPCNSWYMS